MPFPDMNVPVTLTGEEWTTLLARIAGRSLSAKGCRVYNSAARKLKDQLLAASDANQSAPDQRKAALTVVDQDG